MLHLGWGLKAMSLSPQNIEIRIDLIPLFQGQLLHACPFWDALAEQSVQVLIRSLLPRRIRRSKIAPNRESGLKLLVMMELCGGCKHHNPEIPLAPSITLACGVGAQRRMNSKACHINGSWSSHRIRPPFCNGANARANATAALPYQSCHLSLRPARAERSAGQE